MLRRTLLALAALSLLATPAATGAKKKPPSPVKRSATYAGTTSQGPVCRHGSVEGQQCDISFKTSKDRKSIVKLTIRWRGGPCSDNPDRYYRAATEFQNLAVSSKARFKNASTYDAALSDGTKATNAVTLNGRFKRTSSGKYSASGDFSVVSHLVLPDGTTTHCETGRVTWKAKPAS